MPVPSQQPVRLRSIDGPPTDEVRADYSPLLDDPRPDRPVLARLWHDALHRLYEEVAVQTCDFDKFEAVRALMAGERLRDFQKLPSRLGRSVKRPTDGQAPEGGLLERIRRLERRYSEARTHRQRLAVIKDAQTLAGRMTLDRSRVQGTPEHKAAVVADPRSCRAIAHDFGISRQTVLNWKKEARRQRLAA